MIREQQIMERIVNEMGDEFNEYIRTFYVCDLWKIKEGELIVNKTFRRLVDILADFNLTTGDEIMSNAYKLIESNEAMMQILNYLCGDFAKNGNNSLLNRAMVFCYAVFMIGNDKKMKGTDILLEAIESEILKTQTSWWIKLKHKLGLMRKPYSIKGDLDTLLLISILKGDSATDTITRIAEYKELI